MNAESDLHARVKLAIAQAAYPDVHPDFTDAGWDRMAAAAIKAMQEYQSEYQRDGFAIGILGDDGTPSGFFFRELDGRDGMPIWVMGEDRAKWFASKAEAIAYARRKMPRVRVYFGASRR